MTLIQFIAGTLLSLLSLVSQAQTTSTVYYHNDLLGSPLAATNAQGQVVWRESYRPYGERIKNETAAQKERIFFTARHQDPDTGLVYMGARYYDPTIGRFLSTDPVRFYEENIHSFNRYAYANNNPMRFKDPNGMWAEDAVLAAPGLAIGAYSFGQNLKSGSYLSAAVDFGGMALDGIALAVPGVPGGAGLAIAATRKASGAASEAVAKQVTSRIKESSRLVREAEAAGKSHQASLDDLVEKLSQGNMNPGIGTKSIGSGLFEARARDGARVYFRQTESSVEILGKSSKANQDAVLGEVVKTFGR